MVFRRRSGVVVVVNALSCKLWEVNSFLILIFKHADDKVFHFFLIKDAVSVPINDVEVVEELVFRVLLSLIGHNLFNKDPSFILVENSVLVNVKLIPDLLNENFGDAHVFLFAIR